MNTYIQIDGTKTVCSFMKAPALKPGYWWVNVSKLGSGKSIFVETLYNGTE